jgi:phosphonate transport system substrate-binding protein
MKKINKLVLPLSAIMLIAACGTAPVSSSSTSRLPEEIDIDPKVITVQFVPSQNTTRISAQFGPLEEELEKLIPGRDFNISVGTSYAAVAEGMYSGQVHVGFLTSQQYAQASVEQPGKVEVLLTSVRDEYDVFVKNPIVENAIVAMNTDTTYAAQLHPTQKTDSYRSMILTRTPLFNSFDVSTKINNVNDLAGKTVCALSKSSGSGYVYPAQILHAAGLKTITSGTPSQLRNEVKFLTVTSHQLSVTGLLNKDCDASFSFHDVRRDAGLLRTYPNIFADTKVVALSTPIYNDTISSSTVLSIKMRKQIQDAFIALIQTDKGKEIMSIYNHTGYIIATDAAYESEREVYKFRVQVLG